MERGVACVGLPSRYQARRRVGIMRIDFQGRNVEITERFRQHAAPRLETLHRHFEQIQSVKVVVSRQRQWRVVEVTVDAVSTLLRAEERSDEDELTAFDRALDAIEKQINKYKTRLRSYRHRVSSRTAATLEPAEAEEEVGEDEEIRIQRVKYVSLKPMTAQEAAMQMELLGHDFFLFMDAETERIGVVYKRRAGDYGLLLAE